MKYDEITKAVISNASCRHSGLDPESRDFSRKPLDSCFRRNDDRCGFTTVGLSNNVFLGAYDAWAEGDIDIAKSLFQKALSLCPNEINDSISDSILHLCMQDPTNQFGCAEACTPFIEALFRKQHQNSNIVCALGNAYYAVDNYAAARNTFEHLVSFCPTSWAFFNLGNANRYEGRKKEALWCYMQGWLLDPSNVECKSAFMEICEQADIDFVKSASGMVFSSITKCESSGRENEAQLLVALLTAIEATFDKKSGL